MAAVCRNDNRWLTHGIAIAIQVTFIFAFLTVFFFGYVQEVEKKEFESQLNLIVDNILKDVEDDLPNLLIKQTKLSKEDTVVVINGTIDVLQERIAMDAKSTVDDVLEQNHQVKMKALKSLTSVFVIVIVVAVLIMLFGFCIPITYQIKEAMLVVIFVGFTELAFLQIIAKHYISADPNKVKRSLGEAIQKWIRDNHKLK